MAQNPRPLLKFEPAEFTLQEKKTIEQVLTNPMTAGQIVGMLEANDFRNFLFMPIPMLRTKKEQQSITKAFKSISLAAFGSLVFSTVANIKLTPYIIRKPAYVRLPIRTALFAIPLTASFFYIIRPALDGLVYVHMAIERRLMRFYRYGKVKDFFDK